MNLSRQKRQQMRQHKEWVVVIIVSIVLGGLAPFISSSLPDGLERTAKDLSFLDKEQVIINGLFPDYNFGDTIFGNIFASIIGVIISTVIIGLIGIIVFSRNKK